MIPFQVVFSALVLRNENVYSESRLTCLTRMRISPVYDL